MCSNKAGSKHSKVRREMLEINESAFKFYRQAGFKTYDTGVSSFPPSVSSHMRMKWLWLCMEKNAS